MSNDQDNQHDQDLHILHLPDELIEAILIDDYLDYKDVMAASSTCKYLRQIALGCSVWQSKARFRYKW